MTTLSPTAGATSIATTTDARGAMRTPAFRWAVLGVLFLGFQAYLYTRWIASGEAHDNSFGRATAPTWAKTAMWIHFGLGIALFIGMVNHFIVKPWRREHRLTSDGMLMLGCLTCFWGDLGANYFHYQVLYPTVWPNLGGWYGFIPGFGSGAQLQAEATIFYLPSYAIVMFGFTSIAAAAMRWSQRRWTGIGKVRLVLIAWLVLATLDLVLEVPWVHLGLFVYPSTISWLTLFHGHYYQFPIYESLIWGAAWAYLACIRFFKDDRGRTVVERGAERVATGPRGQTVVRFLALAAAANVGLLAYNLTFGLVGTQTGRWVNDISTRPYMTDGLCAAGVTYTCPTTSAP
jgi:hypothetical protein